MKYLVTSIILLSQIFLFAQNQTANLNKLLHRQAELERSISYYQKELKDVKIKIENLRNATPTTEIVSESGQKIVAETGDKETVLRLSPNAQAAEIMKIPANTTIYVHHEHQGMYFKTTYYGKEGWVNYTSIESHPEIDAMIQKPKASSSTTKIVTIDEKDPKYQRLAKIYGREKAVKMINKDLWKGMSHGQVKETLGKAPSQTRENSPKGLKEEWTYPNQKLIFLNGTLLSW